MVIETLLRQIPEKTHEGQLPDNIIDFYSQAAAHIALAMSRESGLLPFQKKEIRERGLLDEGNYSTLRTVGGGFAAEYKPGAVAAIAVTGKKGIMSMPEDIGYMNILAGPPKASREILSLGRTHQNRLQGLMGISVSPFRKDLTFKQEIDDNGFMSIIRASAKATNKKDGPYGDFVVAGQINTREALIAAAAVKALGGIMEPSLENLIPKDRRNIAVCIGLITDDHYFGKPGVIRGGNGSFFVTTAIITHKGINFKSINIEIPGTVTRHF